MSREGGETRNKCQGNKCQGKGAKGRRSRKGGEKRNKCQGKGEKRGINVQVREVRGKTLTEPVRCTLFNHTNSVGLLLINNLK